MLDGRLNLGRKSMLGRLDFVVAELLDEVGADEGGGGEEDLDDDEYCDYHCSCLFSGQYLEHPLLNGWLVGFLYCKDKVTTRGEQIFRWKSGRDMATVGEKGDKREEGPRNLSP
jgi:hypothetical protein